MKRPIRFPMLAGVLLAVLCAAAPQAQTKFSFGVVPQQAASKLARNWGPILSHLSARSGVSLEFKTAPNIPTFEERLSRSEYDFAYMNPYHFVVFNENPGYRAIGHARDRLIRGIIVVRKDSPIASLQDLAGREMAFPAPAAFAASVLPQASLRKLGISVSPKYVSSHDSVYRTVAKGLYPAGGGIVRTLGKVAPEVREQLRVLWTTDGFTPHAFAYRPGLDPSIVARVASAMHAMEADEQGRALLAGLGIKGIAEAGDGRWDDVRALDIRIRTGAGD